MLPHGYAVGDVAVDRVAVRANTHTVHPNKTTSPTMKRESQLLGDFTRTHTPHTPTSNAMPY